MADVKIQMPEEFLLRLSRLAEKTDEILPKVLEAGGKVALQKVKSNLESVVGRSVKTKIRSTGELGKALGLSAARQDRKGDFNVKIGFSEPRADGESNAKFAAILEYGKSGQPPKPFLKPAKSASRTACIEAMETAFVKELEDI
jgi:HK97 gp10 family phage protein